MSPYAVATLVSCSAILLTGLAALWRYQALVGKPARLASLRYRLFALRDRVIRLVADGIMQESDPQWQFLYSQLNEAARAAHISRVSKTGYRFVLALLKNLSAPHIEAGEVEKFFKSFPPEAKKIFVDYAMTVLMICYEGSPLFRVLIKLATRIHAVRNWLKKMRPREAQNYIQFRRLYAAVAGHPIGASGW